MSIEHLDVLIVGAGISGIGAACHLQAEAPDRTFAVLESRAGIGGTWDLFRYPGIRSDSDMFTFGYEFEPWMNPKTIADGASILEYLDETVRRHRIGTRIRFGLRVIRAEWSSDEARWTVTARHEDTGAEMQLGCSFLFVCSGYFRYDAGYTPDLPGREDFGGPVVHPQVWPDGLEVEGKRIVVVGSGATAVTLVPALTDRGATVTMLQRSPTYISARPSRDRMADVLRRALPRRLAFRLIRLKNVASAAFLYRLSRRLPELVKWAVRRDQRKRLPAGYVERHLMPTYQPWDQRFCVVPDGDLFTAIRSGAADIVTDRIERLTEDGVLLRSGTHLQADIVVTATGLQLLAVGGIGITVDGTEVDVASTVAYKGMMLSGIPNFALTIGYTNASWTLKADLVASYVCRLLNRMAETGDDIVVPLAPELEDPALLEPLIDFTSGYVRRSIDRLPKQGPAAPWRLHQNYFRDQRLLRRGPLTDGVRFARAGARQRTEAPR